MTLYVNCCPREDSRTDRIARALLQKLGDYQELNLYNEPIRPLNRERLDARTKLLDSDSLDDPMFGYAKQFASADEIVVAAPFWDLSFPSQLKVYIENIYVTGIVSRYDEMGRPVGLCKAQKLYYVTTAGGPYDGRYSFEYLKTMAQDYFGIPEVELICAEMLDIYGSDWEKIVADRIKMLETEVG